MTLMLYKNNNYAFTLAETLVTLGIIGIIAAMTFPSIIEHHAKIVTANKLKKFYNVMEQTIMQEEVLNEDIKYWLPDDDRYKDWFNEHLAKHLQIIHTEYLKNGNNSFYYIKVALEDGSGFITYRPNTISQSDTANRVFFFYCTEFKYCGIEKYDGRTSFLFSICGDGTFVPSLCSYKKLKREVLLDRCAKGNHDNPNESSKDRRHACARLIQHDGWEIKPDYPWRQIMIEQKEI
ncbi:hypothetical protein DBY21_05815 [Candidatus Gastranaerophilales bacterium]|nr:MAG: hypothetical protein DBY21_05815 [Candidatus Gastranaerophilales bacterium]